MRLWAQQSGARTAKLCEQTAKTVGSMSQVHNPYFSPGHGSGPCTTDMSNHSLLWTQYFESCSKISAVNLASSHTRQKSPFSVATTCVQALPAASCPRNKHLLEVPHTISTLLKKPSPVSSFIQLSHCFAHFVHGMELTCARKGRPK